MGMKYFQIGMWCVTAMLSLAACTEDLDGNPIPETPSDVPTEESDTEAGEIPEGKFVVSYSVGDASMPTRGSDPLAAEHIQSLYHYVYVRDKNATGGELFLKRKIRGINRSTKWPISNREEMSWELRQDLQDTLDDGLDYRVLFVANVDPAHFKKVMDESGKLVPQTLVTGEKNYATARLLLPAEPLTDNTMYYMWEGEIIRTGSTPKPASENQKVLLRRVVARTDFKREVVMNPDGTEHGDRNLYNAIERGFYQTYAAELSNSITGATNNFCKDLRAKVIDKTNGNKAKYPFKGENGEGNMLLKLIEANRDLIAQSIKDLIINKYVRLITPLEKYKKIGTWYTDGNSRVNITYESAAGRGYANALGFDRRPAHVEGSSNVVKLSVEPDGMFRIIGFTGAGYNEINSLRFYQENDHNSFFELTGIPRLEHGLNEKRLYVCDPVWKVETTADLKKERITVNIDNLFKKMTVNGKTWEEFMMTKGIYNSGGWLAKDEELTLRQYLGNECSLLEIWIESRLPNLEVKKPDALIEVYQNWVVK